MPPPEVVKSNLSGNPVARAVAIDVLMATVRKLRLKLYDYPDRAEVRDDMVAAAKIISLVCEAMIEVGRAEDPDCKILRGSLSTLVELSHRKFRWIRRDAVAVELGLKIAVDQYRHLPREVLARIWSEM